MPQSDGRRTHRLIAGVVAALAGAAMIGSTFLGWITTDMVTGGRTSISGWGRISGGAPVIDGRNINALASGLGDGSYRPGLPAAIIGAATLIATVILALTRSGSRAQRWPAVLLGLCGVAGAVWGVWKLFWPGDVLGILPGSAAAADVGPLVTVMAGLVTLIVAAVTLAGVLDPPEPALPRGIQPGR